MKERLIEELKPKAVEFLLTSNLPVCIGDVANHLSVSWSTARQVLMELLLEGKVESEKTTVSMIFRAKGDEKTHDQ